MIDCHVHAPIIARNAWRMEALLQSREVRYTVGKEEDIREESAVRCWLYYLRYDTAVEMPNGC